MLCSPGWCCLVSPSCALRTVGQCHHVQLDSSLELGSTGVALKDHEATSVPTGVASLVRCVSQGVMLQTAGWEPFRMPSCQDHTYQSSP